MSEKYENNDIETALEKYKEFFWGATRRQARWRELNRHNFTTLNVLSNSIENMTAGRGMYSELNAQTYDRTASLTIGNIVRLQEG